MKHAIDENPKWRESILILYSVENVNHLKNAFPQKQTDNANHNKLIKDSAGHWNDILYNKIFSLL